MIEPSDGDTRLLLHAFVDGELDAASALAIERRVSKDPDLRAERDALVAFRDRLGAELPRDVASDRLKAAMAAQAGMGAAATVRAVRAPWPPFLSRLIVPGWGFALAACLVGLLIGAGATIAVMPRGPGSATADVVSDHLRAVMAPQPFDVASSDQHTVKPWFTGRLTFAPQVVDLGEAGFPLVGGRVDVIGGAPAAALVFRHDRHLISLLSQPISPVPSGASTNVRGFSVRQWTSGGLNYWAVSDVSPDELAAFEAAFRARAER